MITWQIIVLSVLAGVCLKPLYYCVFRPISGLLASIAMRWMFQDECGTLNFQEAVRKVYHPNQGNNVGQTVSGHVGHLDHAAKRVRDHLEYGVYYGEHGAGQGHPKSRIDRLEEEVKALKELLEKK